MIIMDITIIYALFIIAYAVLIFLGSTYLEESNLLRNKGKRKKVDQAKKWFSFFIFSFLYAILIYASFYVHYLIVISLLLYATLLFFIAYSIKRLYK